MHNRVVLASVVLLGLIASQLGRNPVTVSAADANSTVAATDVANAELLAALAKIPTAAVSDQPLRVVGINGDYNVAIGIVRRNKTAPGAPGGAIEHDEITEVYHVVSGTGTLVTGGTIDNAKPIDPKSDTVKILVGPGTLGDRVQGGVSRLVGPGDVIVIPPNTPHWFSEVSSDRIVYMVVRVDPKKVLPAGFMPK